MARPTKKGLEYFPLDCQMSDEVNLIIADFGIEGYGVLISMFQSIYGNNGYYTEWTSREQKLFSRKVGLDQELVLKIISECVEWGIFNKNKYEEHCILTSRRIQDHYSTSTYKRTKVDMIEKYLLISVNDKKHINNIVSDDGNPPTNEVSDGESTQSKVQYSKVKYLKDYEQALKLNKAFDTKKQNLLIDNHFESCWKLYPNKKGKDKITLNDKKELFKYTKDQIQTCINNLVKEYPDKQYQMHGRRFFKGEFKDYLKSDYKPPITVVKKNVFNQVDNRSKDNDYIMNKLAAKAAKNNM